MGWLNIWLRLLLNYNVCGRFTPDDFFTSSCIVSLFVCPHKSKYVCNFNLEMNIYMYSSGRRFYPSWRAYNILSKCLIPSRMKKHIFEPTCICVLQNKLCFFYFTLFALFYSSKRHLSSLTFHGSMVLNIQYIIHRTAMTNLEPMLSYILFRTNQFLLVCTCVCHIETLLSKSMFALWKSVLSKHFLGRR